MTKAADRRLFLFNKYKDNLNLLVENGLINSVKNNYICPICLTLHKNLSAKDPLTLEDAPPKSLGGSAKILTCKSCNNICGYKIDAHLVERLRELDSAKFLPGTETCVKINIDGEVFNGKIISEKDGTLKVYHSKQNNHPEILDAKMQELKAGTALDINFLKSKVIPENLEYALLKTGYLLVFAKLGYALILDKCFDTVRQQLQNPEKRIIPEGFWISPPYLAKMSGVYFVCDQGMECLLALFNLNTGFTERTFGTFIPLPINPIEKVIKEFNIKSKIEKYFHLNLYPLEQDKTNYLYDLANLKAMYTWIDNRKT